MAEWTRDVVEERVMEAAMVLAKLPGPRVGGYFSTWPERELVRQLGDKLYGKREDPADA